jgi:DNA repair protein RadC
MPERFDPPGYIQQPFDFEAELGTSAEVRKLHRLHESLVPYLDTQQLRQLVAEHRDLRAALQSDQPPAEVLALLDTLSALLRPSPTEQIRSPADVVGILMVQMAHLDQEELRTVLLDTKNRVQDIVTVYRGSLNMSLVRAGEVYKAAVRRNSSAIVFLPSPLPWN